MFNKFQILGRVVKDIELRQKGSLCYSFMRLASTPEFGNKDNTVFTDVVLFNGNAKAASANLTKGDTVFVEGTIVQTRDGRDIRLVARRVVFLSRRKSETQKAVPEVESEIEELAKYIHSESEAIEGKGSTKTDELIDEDDEFSYKPEIDEPF